MIASGEAAQWVGSISTVVLVGITAWYAKTTRDLLNANVQQAKIAQGRDDKALLEKRRDFLLQCRNLRGRLDEMLKFEKSPGALKHTPLWAEEDIRRFESLGVELPEVNLDQVHRVTRHFRRLKDLVRLAKVMEKADPDPNVFATALGNDLFWDRARESESALRELIRPFEDATHLIGGASGNSVTLPLTLSKSSLS